MSDGPSSEPLPVETQRFVVEWLRAEEHRVLAQVGGAETRLGIVREQRLHCERSLQARLDARTATAPDQHEARVPEGRDHRSRIDAPRLSEALSLLIERQALALIQSGYRATSNKYRRASRIDRPDWRLVMARHHLEGHPGDPDFLLERGLRWVTGLGDGAADFYRRCLSTDHLDRLPQATYDLIRKAGDGSGWGGLNEYRPLVSPETGEDVLHG